ncbi:hypothetical protein [Pseudomonas sp. REB1044]|uniref:hypothetical protein n=1 Tax=Pseudomonas sp. REB1044 TaxID=2675224 RepID=UPI00315C729B
MNVVSTPFHDALPSMIGFAEERIGIPKCEWTSPCYLLADRDLALDEVIRVWAVDRRDGRVLKVVALKAKADYRTQDKWPVALIKAIRYNNTLINNSKLLHAGVIKGVTFEAGATSHSTADCVAASSHEDYNRLWVFSTYARLFTNAPFAANQVMAHNLANVDFQAAQRVCVQVRDRVSQGLLESIVVTFEASTDSSARAKALCEAVLKHSEVLRAGVLADDGISISPSDQGNALWIPQFSELSVTVDTAPWVPHGNFTASRALTADEELRVHVHDDVTGMPLKGSPIVFKASADELEQGKWPAALAKKLQASPLGDYLALELDNAKGASGQWKCAGVPLRIVMSAPLEENDEWVPLLPDSSQPGQSISMSEQLRQIANSLVSAMAEARMAQFEFFLPITGDYESDMATVHPLELTLRDIRTGYVCYRLNTEYSIGSDISSESTDSFTEKLMSIMRGSGMPDVVSRSHNSASNNTKSSEDTLALWLPKRLGMTASLSLRRVTELFNYDREADQRDDQRDDWTAVKPLRLELTHTVIPDPSGLWDATYDTPEPEDRPKQRLNNQTEKNPQYDTSSYFPYYLLSRQSFVSGEITTIPQLMTQLKLEPKTISAGVRCLSVAPAAVGIEVLHDSHKAILEYAAVRANACTLCLSPPFHSPFLASIEAIEARFTPKSPWFRPVKHDIKKPDDYIASFSPDSTLCVDRCMTLGAHVYDTGGARDNGVDENTGLFHAHYPVATLKGLAGQGPELDLTLHYSAVRANEGALGDGWAFRFSYFDNRRRLLTLSSGQTLTLTKAQMKSLSADKTQFLDQDGYRITAVEGDENAWTSLTIEIPPGVGARLVVLRLPAPHDGKEAGTAFKEALKEKLEAIIANLTQWIDKEKITRDQITNLKKQRDTWKAELADIDRESLVLVTSTIRSPHGGELNLAWQGVDGHIRLDSIKDGSTVLLRANHGSIVAQGSSQSTFTVWPDTPEGYEVTLDIRNCLLESIKRHRAGQTQTPERHVRFNYDYDPALDRVLTGIAEEDGSLEVVHYKSKGGWNPVAPRVQMHTLVPGAGQPCIAHYYKWAGEYVVEKSLKQQLGGYGAFRHHHMDLQWRGASGRFDY